MNYGVLPWHVNYNDSIAYYKFDRAHGNIVRNEQQPNAYDGVATTSDDQNYLWDTAWNATRLTASPRPRHPRLRRRN